MLGAMPTRRKFRDLRRRGLRSKLRAGAGEREFVTGRNSHLGQEHAPFPGRFGAYGLVSVSYQWNNLWS